MKSAFKLHCGIGLLFVLLSLCTACGSGGGGGDGDNDEEGNAAIQAVEAVTAGTKTFNATDDTVSVPLQTTVTDADGNPVEGADVTFETDIGSFLKTTAALPPKNTLFLAGSPLDLFIRNVVMDFVVSPVQAADVTDSITVQTDTNGIAEATLVYPQGTSPQVSAKAGKDTVVTSDPVIIPYVNDLQVSVADPTLPADGLSSTPIKATVLDAEGQPMSNVLVLFQSSSGTLSQANATSNANGIAAVNLKSSTTPGQAEIVVTAETITQADAVTFQAVSIASLSLASGSSSLLADGVSSTTCTASLESAQGSIVPDGTQVTFSSTAGDIDPTQNGVQTSYTTTTVNGQATATLTSPTNVGGATITVTAGGVSDTTTVQFIPGAPAIITLTAKPASLTADGSSTSLISTTVLDAQNNAVQDGEILTFSVQHGQLDNLTQTTSGGFANVTYTSPSFVPADKTDTITVETTNNVSQNASITLSGPQISGIVLTAYPDNLPADNSSQSSIMADVSLIGGGSAPDGTKVDFSIIQGGGIITSTATTAGGTAVATLTSGNQAGTAVIQATAGGKSADLEVTYTAGQISLEVVPNAVLATGEDTAVVTATLKDISGLPAPDGETVQFSMSNPGLGNLPATASTSGGQGVAKTTFTAGSEGGEATIYASWQTGGANATATADISLHNPPAFLETAPGSPDPATINIVGTGGEPTAFIAFQVKDIQGDLVNDGYRIDFSIDSSPNGGESLSPQFAYTKNGTVNTILKTGTKSGPVSVKAAYHQDTSISTTTSQIAIEAGPPVGEEFGIAAQHLNISGLWMEGLQDPITINAADRYGNAIPDNTAISFKTYNTGGYFQSGTALTANGTATATFMTPGTNTTPLEGFAWVTAEANSGRTTRITSLEVTPSPDEHILYAGTNGGGIYKSTDSGVTWTNISRSTENPKAGQNILEPYIKGNTAIAVDPDDHNTIYAGTGYLGRGHLYRSLDGGLNWNSNDPEQWAGVLSLNQAVLSVACDGGGTDYVWIGTEGKGALFASDGETFEPGGKVSDPVFSGTGNGNMTQPVPSSTSKTETWEVVYQLTGIEVTDPVLDTAGSNSGAEGDISVNATTAADNETWTLTYTGGFDFSNNSLTDNNNHGSLTVTTAKGIAADYTITCTNGTDGAETFSVHSSKEGWLDPFEDITQNYSSDSLSFYVQEDAPGDFTTGDTFAFSTNPDGWSVQGSVSGPMSDATTNVPYTSDNLEINFLITQESSDQPFQFGDTWTFDTHRTYRWTATGDVSGLQTKKAQNGVPYASDNNEVSFLISEGSVPFAIGDTFSFQVQASGLGHGKIVREMVKAPDTHGNTAVLYAATGNGVYRSSNGGTTWSPTSAFTGNSIISLALHPDSDGVIDTIYVGTEEAGVFVSTDNGGTWTQYILGLGQGLSASTPQADMNNSGNGVISNLSINATTTLSENWTLTALNATTFTVSGSISGEQSQAVVDQAYSADNKQVSLTIAGGSVPFAAGDTFTFKTTRDPGLTINDLLVDGINQKLYCTTYFWGALEPHAVGNVYVLDLTPDGAPVNGEWTQSASGLAQFDPPQDSTLLAQHALAVDNPDNPGILYLGGEGISLHRAVDGLNSGSPSWVESQTGLSNLIMARMPVLLSGQCDMEVEQIAQTGNTVTFRVYIQDVNGNPPIKGSSFTVQRQYTKDGESTYEDATLRDIEYADGYTHLGTWRNPADPETNTPYIIHANYESGSKFIFEFIPACGQEAPGCSGSDQEISLTY